MNNKNNLKPIFISVVKNSFSNKRLINFNDFNFENITLKNNNLTHKKLEYLQTRKNLKLLISTMDLITHPFFFEEQFSVFSSFENRIEAMVIMMGLSNDYSFKKLSNIFHVPESKVRKIINSKKNKENLKTIVNSDIESFYIFYGENFIKKTIGKNYIEIIKKNYFEEFTWRINDHSYHTLEPLNIDSKNIFLNLLNIKIINDKEIITFKTIRNSSKENITFFWNDVILKWGLYSEETINEIYLFYGKSPFNEKKLLNKRTFMNRIETLNFISFNDDVKSKKKLILPITSNKTKRKLFEDVEKKLNELYDENELSLLSFREFVNKKIEYDFLKNESLFNNFLDFKNKNVLDSLPEIIYTMTLKGHKLKSSFGSFRYPIIFKNNFKEKNKIKSSPELAYILLREEFVNETGFFKSEIKESKKLYLTSGIEEHWWSNNIHTLESRGSFQKKQFISGKMFYFF